MVEQTRRSNHVVTLQAGPGQADTSAPFDMNFRIRDAAARVIGRHLAVIGDQLDREWAGRDPNQPPTPLHLLRPAQSLTQTIYWDVHSQLWGFQGLFAALKTWVMSTVPGQGNFRAKALTAWESSFKPVSCPGWTGGALVIVTLAAAGIFGALWMEERA
ncbi:bcl-2-interacting killer [Nematolebias whitei]|uniref:bcl-2-interacting killer n=1 Tax=Nematolebias whitei TaxID=451745 RepID=UPI00189996E0|nr:bcl-2-interacting killer [Nematolebias whitei]